MSTNASVHVKGTDGQVRSIYVHWDGYLSHVGKLLRDSYDTQELADDLIHMGDCSSLEETLEDSTFYHRDRNEDWDDVQPNVSNDLQSSLEANSQSFDYYFEDGVWHLVADGTAVPFSDVNLS
jgi:hypothetical protein